MERHGNQLNQLVIIMALFAMVVFSCDRINVEEITPSEKVILIDSIIVNSPDVIGLSALDTISLDLEVFPKTVALSSDVLSNHELYLQKSNNGEFIEPSAYKIVSFEKNNSLPELGNSYKISIADIDAGYGYKDTVQICMNIDGAIVLSRALYFQNAGTELLSFSLYDGRSSYQPFNVRNDTIQIQVPNTYDLSNTMVLFKHNGKDVYVNDEIQKLGGGPCDFTDFFNNTIIVKGFDDEERVYAIEVFNLPIVFVNTPDSVEITSRYDWLENCSFWIRDTDGSFEDYGIANVKGRGNWSWRVGLQNGKKPLAIKLANKPKKTILGMPGHKRWVLLANPMDYLVNPLGFEVNRRTESCKWAPNCRYVELFLNGCHKGLYLLVEQIRIDKNRIDIKELKQTDIDGDAVTGGYLISYDDAEEDMDSRFYSRYFKMPVMIKNPDEDDIVPQQLDYIQNYINEMEASLFDDALLQSNSYEDYFEMDSWIDYYFLEEFWGAFEMWRPRSVWLYKDRNGKMCAGPGWDYENSYFDKQELMCKDYLYYGKMFQDRSFVEKVKNRWPIFYSNIIGNSNYNRITDYVDSLYTTIKWSAYRDRYLYPSAIPQRQINLETEYNQIKEGILNKLEWLGNEIANY